MIVEFLPTVTIPKEYTCPNTTQPIDKNLIACKQPNCSSLFLTWKILIKFVYAEKLSNISNMEDSSFKFNSIKLKLKF